MDGVQEQCSDTEGCRTGAGWGTAGWKGVRGHTGAVAGGYRGAGREVRDAGWLQRYQGCEFIGGAGRDEGSRGCRVDGRHSRDMGVQGGGRRHKGCGGISGCGEGGCRVFVGSREGYLGICGVQAGMQAGGGCGGRDAEGVQAGWGAVGGHGVCKGTCGSVGGAEGGCRGAGRDAGWKGDAGRDAGRCVDWTRGAGLDVRVQEGCKQGCGYRGRYR